MSDRPSPALSRYLAFRRQLPPRPLLARSTIRARGIDFAVFSTPAIDTSPPLLCVNGGLLFDHKLLWPAISLLASSRQLILYDQRGRGESSVPPGVSASRIEFDAGDVPALQDALGIAKWDILGHSWGGGIAMLATALRPESVRRLVLVDAVGVTSAWLPGLHAAALSRLTGAAREKLANLDPALLVSPEIGYHADYAQAFFPAWFADPEFAASVSPPRGTSRTGAVVAARLRNNGYDWTAQLGDFDTPTLVLHGAADVLPLSEARNTASLLRNSMLVPIANAGHNPFWEAPDAFFSAVINFLEGESPPN